MIVGMREADAVFLDTLRKSVAAEVDCAVWKSVEEQAAEVGVLGLTGTARALVEGLVLKHGSHDQKSHAGGGAGGGGESKRGGGEPSVRQMQSAATFLDNEGDVSSEHFAPKGIGNMSMRNAKRMVSHAKKLGWKEE